MRVVIDIDDNIYTRLFDNGVPIDLTTAINDATDIKTAIRKGKPLPEHYGRLIDISEYEKYFNTAITYDDGNHEHVVYTNTIPTIIEGSDSE